MLRSAKIEGQVAMGGSSHFEKGVDADSIIVGSSLFMRGARFAAPLSLVFAQVKSNLTYALRRRTALTSLARPSLETCD